MDGGQYRRGPRSRLRRPGRKCASQHLPRVADGDTDRDNHLRFPQFLAIADANFIPSSYQDVDPRPRSNAHPYRDSHRIAVTDRVSDSVTFTDHDVTGTAITHS